LGDAWLISFAADVAIGARAAVTIGSTIIPRRVLRKLAADFVADTFDLRGGMLADGNFAGERRNTEAKCDNQDEEDCQISHDTLQLCTSPPEIIASVQPFHNRGLEPFLAQSGHSSDAT